jgi:hypothetical protein
MLTQARNLEMAQSLITRLLIGGSLAVWLLFAASASADTIYTWTDDQGFRHFSNLPPPKQVRQFSTIETRITTLPCEGPKERRRSYDQMIEEYQNESRQRELQRQQEFQRQANQRQLDQQNRTGRFSFQGQPLEDQIHSHRIAVTPISFKGARSNRTTAHKSSHTDYGTHRNAI